MEISRKVARLARELNYESLDPSVTDRAKYLLLDFLGVAIRGSQTDSSRLIQRFLSANLDTSRGVPVIGTHMRAEASYAALANGTGSHSLELDDVVNAASLHPAVAIMPAALSAGCLAGCSGRELLEGIIAGYELAIKLGMALDPAAHYQQGFHPTGTCGTFGAALASAKILKLDDDRIARALGIAGSQSSGSMEFLADGSFTKRLHAGWAAHAGLIAALLAREGFTGPASIFEGRSGFLHAYSPLSDPGKVLAGWGQPYEVLRTSIKPHACCRYKQGPIDGILEIMKKHRLKASELREVKVGVLKAGYPIVVEPKEIKYNPKSVVDAQFSMPFGAAVAVLYGRASLNEYTQEKVESSEVREMMGRISCLQDPDLERDFPKRWPASVSIATQAGKVFETHVDYPKGDPENPLTWEELIQKFNDLTAPVFEVSARHRIVDLVRNLEAEGDLKRLTKLLARNDKE